LAKKLLLHIIHAWWFVDAQLWSATQGTKICVN
jgi:hypothetical protein